MPTYAYHCDKCGNSVDYILKVNDRDSKVGMHCTECAAGHLQREITVPHFGDAMRMGMGPKNVGGIRDALQRIHERTPGSRLDQTSTINKL